ncbi:inositol monophosphatase, partial [bacterium]|nr:inositol monophosphatase [bacterium]
ADIEVENFLRKELFDLYPNYGFWGEESGKVESGEGRWIVDPIDGTHSFFRGQYFWSISVALEIAGKIQLGAVYAPALGDLYLAEKGKGAWKNGDRVKVSEVDVLTDSMVCTGFACLRSSLEDNNLERFCRIALKTRDQRRFGSAALDLCMVADGQLDAFWEQHLNLYDVAAGTLIALEAGGTVCNFKGISGLDPEEILVTNGKILDEMLELM